MTAVRCPEMVTKRIEPRVAAHLREFYGPHMRLDPAVLAYKLGLRVPVVINMLSQLGLRNKRHAS